MLDLNRTSPASDLVTSYKSDSALAVPRSHDQNSMFDFSVLEYDDD